jgi:hypothetical protein
MVVRLTAYNQNDPDAYVMLGNAMSQSFKLVQGNEAQYEMSVFDLDQIHIKGSADNTLLRVQVFTEMSPVEIMQDTQVHRWCLFSGAETTSNALIAFNDSPLATAPLTGWTSLMRASPPDNTPLVFERI